MSMATTTWLRLLLLPAHVPRPQDLEHAKSDTRYDAGKHAGKHAGRDRTKSSYLGVLIQSRFSIHVPISVRSRSGKGVYMHFKSLVEVLFDSLSDNDCM